jgi:hypothetical protein
VFEKTKQRINTELNDRINAPVKAAVILSSFALVISLVALFIVASKVDN